MEFSVNTDEDLRGALRYNVRAVPTIVVKEEYVIGYGLKKVEGAHFKIEGLTSLLGTNSTLGLCIMG